MLDSRLPMPFGDHGGLSFNQVYFYDTPPPEPESTLVIHTP